MEKMVAVNLYMPEIMKTRIDALIGRKSRNDYIRKATEKQLVIDEAELKNKE